MKNPFTNIVRKQIDSAVREIKEQHAAQLDEAYQAGKAETVRAYNAAKSNLLYGWKKAAIAIDNDIRDSLSAVRERARNGSKNNDLIKAALLLNRANVPGPEGFKLQVEAKNPDGSLDEYANELIESKFLKWCKKEYCTMQGRLSFRRVQWLVWMTLKRDGEFIVRKVYPKVKDNPFAFSLDLLDPDDLAETYNAELKNGNVVKMGVELNEWRKPVAYYIRKRNLAYELPYYSNGLNRELERVPAEDIIFDFDQEFTKQTRGMSHFVQSLLRFKMLEEWDHWSLDNATASAKKLGIMVEKQLDNVKFTGDKKDADTGSEYIEVDGLHIQKIPFGNDFQAWKPEFPTDQHVPFKQMNQTEIAAGIGMSYHTLTGDLTKHNYSGLKKGDLKDQDQWITGQTLMIDSFLVPVFETWLQMGLMSGEIKLPYAKYDKFNKPVFYGKRWKQIEPLKEANAAKIKIDNGLSSVTKELAEQGIDIKDLWQQLKKEKDLAEKLGLDFKKEPAPQDPADEEDPDANDVKENKTAADDKLNEKQIYKIG